MTRTVVLIDDDRAVLASLEALFATADYGVRAFGSATGFLDEIETIPPACVVTDLRLPNMDGLALIKRLKSGLRPDWPVVMITGHADVAKAVEVMQAGALDVLVKPFAPTRLLDVVSRAMPMHDKAAAKDASDADERYRALTTREQQVTELLIAGASSKSAGLVLGISPRTVDVFRGKITRKMGVSSIGALSTAVASVKASVRIARP